MVLNDLFDLGIESLSQQPASDETVADDSLWRPATQEQTYTEYQKTAMTQRRCELWKSLVQVVTRRSTEKECRNKGTMIRHAVGVP
jgi:hypothetical protein